MLKELNSETVSPAQEYPLVFSRYAKYVPSSLPFRMNLLEEPCLQILGLCLGLIDVFNPSGLRADQVCAPIHKGVWLA